MSQRAFVPLPKNAGIANIPTGGKVRAAGDSVLAPETLGVTETGVAFGPIELGVPAGGVCNLESLTFGPGESDDDGFLAMAAVGGSAPAAASRTNSGDKETKHSQPTRRGVLTALVATATAATLSKRAGASEDELVTLNLAKFDLAEPNAPVTVTVLDIVEEVLPPSTDILVDQEATRVGDITSIGEGVTLEQTAGTVRIYIRDTLGKLAQLLAWVKSIVPSDASLTYRRPLPDDTKASEYEEDEFVRLTSHPAIVGPIEEADPDRTILMIGNTKIPHVDAADNEAGAWALLDGTLVYEVGSNPPAVSEWDVTTRLSAWQAWRQSR